MLGKSLLAALMLMAAVFACTPRSDGDDVYYVPKEHMAKSHSPWALKKSPSISDTSSEAGWGTSLERRRDGHFYAEAYVNDVPTHFMVDTGASTIALTGSDAEAIGLYWSDEDVIPVARGASGTVYGVRVTLDNVELGGFEARNLEAIIVPEGLDVSLLGQSFLSTIDNVNIKGDQMVLGR